MIELIVVMAILAIMGALAIPTFARMGFFSGNELQNSARELFALLKSAQVYASTYHIDTAVVYGISLEEDSFTGQAIEAIDSIAMVYKIPRFVRERCANLPATVRDDTTVDLYTPAKGEAGQTMFSPLVRDTAIQAKGLLPDGAGAATFPVEMTIPATTLKPIRVYEVEQLPVTQLSGSGLPGSPENPLYDATLVRPLLLGGPAGAALLSKLPPWLNYLNTNYPAGDKYIEYCPNLLRPQQEDEVADFRFPAHVFSPSGALDFYGAERFRIMMGYAPDADVIERFADESGQDPRVIQIEFFRATGRIRILGQEG